MERFLFEKKIRVDCVSGQYPPVYVEAIAEDCSGYSARAVISGGYNDLVLLEQNGLTLLDTRKTGCGSGDGKSDPQAFRQMTLRDLICFAENVPLKNLYFLRDLIRINWKLAKYGLSSGSGMGVGRTIRRISEEGRCAANLISEACMMTSAAIDARMGGCDLPAMSCVGSGNQGILASVPIITVTKCLGSGKEKLLRALALSVAVTIYTKEYLGKISVLCGCGTTAGVGCVAGITYLLGGNQRQIVGSMNNLIAGTCGMICDGAKEGCALKAMNTVHAAMQSAFLAIHSVAAGQEDGIIDGSEQETIRNLQRLDRLGMAGTDAEIIHILRGKFAEEQT